MSKRKTKLKSKMFKVTTTMTGRYSCVAPNHSNGWSRPDDGFIVPADFAEDLLSYADSCIVEINATRARLLREERALIKQHIEIINDLLRSYGNESTG